MADVETLLADYPKRSKFFQELTAGYQKGWVRYVFSAKQLRTKDDWKTQMIDILAHGYKSINLYRQKNK